MFEPLKATKKAQPPSCAFSAPSGLRSSGGRPCEAGATTEAERRPKEIYAEIPHEMEVLGTSSCEYPRGVSEGNY